MASPRLENGALHLSDAIWDALTRFRLSGREWQVLLVILLKGGSDEMQRISINQFSKATGIPSGGVHGALQGLLAKNVIIKLEETKNKGLADWWGFQEDHAEWQLKLTTATPKKAVKAKKPPPKKVIQQELFAEP
jgi:phage replication O-like protein O